VLLLSKHNAVLKKWLDDKAFRKHNITYMSHDSQNEFIDLLSNEVKKSLQNLILLNTNKDILDTIDTRVLVKKWSHLKHRRIEV